MYDIKEIVTLVTHVTDNIIDSIMI